MDDTRLQILMDRAQDSEGVLLSLIIKLAGDCCWESCASSHSVEMGNLIGYLQPELRQSLERVKLPGSPSISVHYLALIDHDIIPVVLDINSPSPFAARLPLVARGRSRTESQAHSV